MAAIARGAGALGHVEGGGGERRRGGDGSARSASAAAMLSVEGETAPMVVRGAAGALGHVKGGIRRGKGRELEEDKVGGCVSHWRLVL